MSNKKFKLTKEQIKQKKSLLSKMEKEIVILKKDIKYATFKSIKIKTKKGIKISLRIGQFIAPFILSAGLITLSFLALHFNPFILEKRPNNLQIIKEFNSLGDIKYEQQYEKIESYQNTISYVDAWKLEEDGLYTRNIKEYSVKDLSIEKIDKIVLNNDYNSLEELLSDPPLVKTEKSNSINETEKNQKPYVLAKIYSEDDTDYTYIKESGKDNLPQILFYTLSIVFSEYICLKWRQSDYGLDIVEAISNINKKHKNIDVDELKRKLLIKKNNYDRLKGKD